MGRLLAPGKSRPAAQWTAKCSRIRRSLFYDWSTARVSTWGLVRNPISSKELGAAADLLLKWGAENRHGSPNLSRKVHLSCPSTSQVKLHPITFPLTMEFHPQETRCRPPRLEQDDLPCWSTDKSREHEYLQRILSGQAIFVPHFPSQQYISDPPGQR